MTKENFDEILIKISPYITGNATHARLARPISPLEKLSIALRYLQQLHSLPQNATKDSLKLVICNV
jgi:hypothetical protein